MLCHCIALIKCVSAVLESSMASSDLLHIHLALAGTRFVIVMIMC